MTAWLNQPFVRAALFILLWGLAGLAGWWWHRPPTFADRPANAADHPLSLGPSSNLAERTPNLGPTIQAADPFGLSRSTPLSAPSTSQGEVNSDAIVWRFAAIAIQGGERHLLMTANDQQPLLLKKGDKLPNGERITAIEPTGVQLANAAGRKRNIQLIEP